MLRTFFICMNMQMIKKFFFNKVKIYLNFI